MALAESKKKQGRETLSSNNETENSRVGIKLILLLSSLILIVGGGLAAYYFYSISPLSPSTKPIDTTPARKLDIPKSVPIIGGNGFNSPNLMKNAGEAAEGVIVGAAWNTSSASTLNRKFVEAFSSRFGTLPDQFAAQAYAGVYIAYQAISKAPSPDDHKAIRDALAQIKGMNTVLGTFSFTDGRDADYVPVVQVVKDGKFVVFGE